MKQMKRVIMAVALSVSLTAFPRDRHSLTIVRENQPVGETLVSMPEGTCIKSLTDLPDGSVSTSRTFTVEFWFKLTGDPTDEDLNSQVLFTQYADGNSARTYIGVNGGNLYFFMGSRNIRGNTVLTSGRWYHAAFVRDSGGYMSLYLDGVKDSAAEVANRYPLPEVDIEIASLSQSSNVTAFDGKVSEMRVWNVARTESEIAETRFMRMTGKESGLLYCWPFDDGAGTTCRELVSGNDATVAVPGNVVWNDEEPSFLPTRRHSLDIRRADSDYGVWVGTPPGTYIKSLTDLPDGSVSTSRTFTVEFWFKMTGDPASGSRILFTQYADGNSARTYIGVKDGFLYFYMVSRTLSGQTRLRSGRWYHAAFVRDSGGYMSLYLDGVKDSAAEVANRYPLPENDIALASLHQSGTPTSFDGRVSEMRVWNVARSAEQIAASMEERADGTEEGLLYCWPFDDGAGTMCRELVAGRHARIYKTSYVSWAEELPPVFRVGFQIILR